MRLGVANFRAKYEVFVQTKFKLVFHESFFRFKIIVKSHILMIFTCVVSFWYVVGPNINPLTQQFKGAFVFIPTESYLSSYVGDFELGVKVFCQSPLCSTKFAVWPKEDLDDLEEVHRILCGARESWLNRKNSILGDDRWNYVTQPTFCSDQILYLNYGTDTLDFSYLGDRSKSIGETYGSLEVPQQKGRIPGKGYPVLVRNPDSLYVQCSDMRSRYVVLFCFFCVNSLLNTTQGAPCAAEFCLVNNIKPVDFLNYCLH